MKRVHQISNRKKQPLYLLFVDVTTAFHHIPRKWLLFRLRFREGEKIKFDILGKLYQKISLTYQEAQVTFLVTSGIRQDDSIRFFRHQYEISARSVLSFYCTLVWLCGQSDFIHGRHSFTAESYNHS